MDNIGQIAEFLAASFNLTGVRPIRLDLYDRSAGNSYFEGYEGSERLFIKWGGKGLSCRNEFEYGSRLYAVNREHFIQPRFFQCDEAARCLGLSYVESETLQDKLRRGELDAADKAEVIRQLLVIAEALLAANCVHRDINPVNLVLTPQKRLLLVDFQFAVDSPGYAEHPDILANPRHIHFLGTGFFELNGRRFKFGPDRFQWDDMYSFLKLLEYIGCAESYRPFYEKARGFFSENLGRRAISFPGRDRLLLRRKLYKFLSAPLPVKSWRDKVRMLYLKGRPG